jgi:MYXO-CTERM domain-containing protein
MTEEKTAPDPEWIESEIEETREELGDTVAALADKADVKKQAKEKADEAKDHVQQRIPDPILDNPVPVAAAAIGLVLLLLVRRRRKR